MKRLGIGIFALILIGLVGFCTYPRSRRPFLTIEVCLKTDEQIPVFVRELHSVAQSEGMTFLDNSARTQKELESTGERIPQAKPIHSIINIDVGRGDGMGVGAVNVGLPGGQVALGFSEGRDIQESRQFADKVVGMLKSKWATEVVTSGGAQGMVNCK